MTHLEFYDLFMQSVLDLRNRGSEMINESGFLERSITKRMGLEFHDRDPGFPCWCHNKLVGFFSTPREALAKLDEL